MPAAAYKPVQKYKVTPNELGWINKKIIYHIYISQVILKFILKVLLNYKSSEL